VAAKLLSVGFVLLISPALWCEEWFSKEAGIVFQLPQEASWHKIAPPQPEAKLALQSKDGATSILFFAIAAPYAHQKLDQEFIDGFLEGYKESGVGQAQGAFRAFKGKEAYQAKTGITAKGQHAQGLLIIWIENGQVFEISALKRDADPLTDPVVAEFLKLAQFKTTTQAPTLDVSPKEKK
jgi:hypothetical protein